MYLKLDDKFVITTDQNNFVLNELKIKGKESKSAGEEYLVALAFYGSLQFAIRGYLKNSLRMDSDNINGVESLLNKLDTIEAIISKIK